MENENGLLSNKDVATRADINANIYRRTINGIPYQPDFNRVKAFGYVNILAGEILIVRSFNIVSVTRTTIGNYLVTLLTPFSFAGYAVNATIEGETTGGTVISYTILSTTSFRIIMTSPSGLPADPLFGFSYSVYGFTPAGSDPPDQVDTVIANNGLLNSSDSNATGDVNSNYYVRKSDVPELPPNGLVKGFATVTSIVDNIITFKSSLNIQSIVGVGGSPGVYRVTLITPFIPANSLFTVLATSGFIPATPLVARYVRETTTTFLLTFTRSEAPGLPVQPPNFSFVIFAR